MLSHPATHLSGGMKRYYLSQIVYWVQQALVRFPFLVLAINIYSAFPLAFEAASLTRSAFAFFPSFKSRLSSLVLDAVPLCRREVLPFLAILFLFSPAMYPDLNDTCRARLSRPAWSATSPLRLRKFYLLLRASCLSTSILPPCLSFSSLIFRPVGPPSLSLYLGVLEFGSAALWSWLLTGRLFLGLGGPPLLVWDGAQERRFASAQTLVHILPPPSPRIIIVAARTLLGFSCCVRSRCV
ncbi:hypothetical protein DFH06DRAFT_1230325 [Mycena polygramma]|nr:hypothetical protein DFH06DRAFT_1230325 [Mycena polygramma]